MKFFQTLSSIANTAVATQSDHRHQASERDYQTGMQILLQAQLDAFKDLSRLQQASDHFLAAIRHHHRNPDPYIGMAYLLHLLEDAPGALRYLSEALRVDPGNQSAYSLQLAIQEQAAQSLERQPEQPPPDSDLAYDQLEDLISREIRLISSYPPPRASLDPEQVLELESRFEQLSQNFGLIQAQIEIQSQELDLLSLQSRLRPIETRIKGFEQALSQSRLMLALNQEMEQEYEATLCLSQYLLYQSPETARLQLESTLDTCDEVADQINRLDAAGAATEALEVSYHKLKAVVLHLQESIDEMKQ
ncbi:MAG: hypothetical protein CVV27_17290 [Candidatus Melainabacteria bacterium HGW-Melainabacteria-1]|nr:MAG: hypothetical protein CVV27_17290 [Candidatus Melainabacteria bacterium HGW-Melainabacteria-1]